jgi:selenoprotein W-related protein
LAGEIIAEFGDDVETITLVRGSGGRFEVTVDGGLLFSKAATQRHPQPGEVVDKIRAIRAQAASGRDLRRSAH